MAKKKKAEEHENHERWLVSYADFITLLFAFFVVMYAVSSVNEGKYRVLSDSLMSAFQSSPKSLEPIQFGKTSKSPVITELTFRSSPQLLKTPKPKIRSQMDEASSIDGDNKFESEELVYDDPGAKRFLDRVEDDVELAMSHLISLGLIHVRRSKFWLEIVINSSVLFGAGEAKLKKEVLPVLSEIATVMSGFPNAIRVEGYTDNQDIGSDYYPSNWELSSSRASSVVRLFELFNVNSDRMTAVGYAQNRPVADNSTEEGRALNRRVAIIVMANNDVAKVLKQDLMPDNSASKQPNENQLSDNDLFMEELNQENVELPLDPDEAFVQKHFKYDPQDNNSNRTTEPGDISAPIRLFRPLDLSPSPIPLNDLSEQQ